MLIYVVLKFLASYLIFGVVGYVLLVSFFSFIGFKDYKTKLEHIFIIIPLGIIFTEIFMFFICFFYVDNIIVLIYIISFLIFFFTIIFKKRKKIYLQLKRNNKFLEWKKIFCFIIVFVFTLLLLSFFVYNHSTTPAGDSVYHDTVTAMIITNKKYPIENISDLFKLIRYPRGWQNLGVFNSLLFGFPIHTNLLLAGIICSIIPLLIYNIIYIRTKSIGLSVFGFTISILVYPNFDVVPAARDFIIGNLANGTYPQQFGFFLVLSFFSFLIFMNHLNPEAKIINFIPPTILFSIAIFLASYPLVFFSIAFLFILMMIWIWRSLLQKIEKRYALFLFITIIVIFFFIWIITFEFFVYNYLSDFFSINLLKTKYFINLDYLFANYYGLIILSAFSILIVKILLSKTIEFSDLLFFITFSVLVGSIFVPEILKYTIIRPTRSFIPLVGISLISLCINSSIIYNYLKEEISFKNSMIKIKNKVGKIFVLLKSLFLRNKFYKFIIKKNRINHFKKSSKLGLQIGIFFLIFSYALGNIPIYHRYSDNDWTTPEDSTYKVITWINENIDPDELILNDPSFAGLRLSTFSYRNLIFVYPTHLTYSKYYNKSDSYYDQRANESLQIFQNPYNTTNIRRIFKKYNISYFYFAGQYYYYDYWKLSGQKGYFVKTTYYWDFVDILINCSCLKMEYRDGLSAVFSYNQND